MTIFSPAICFSSRLLRVSALLCAVGLASCDAVPVVGFGPAIVPLSVVSEKQILGCGQDHLAHLIGQPFTELAKFRLRGHLRVLRPGQGVTRDLMPDRLNAQVDGSGVILRLFCG